MGRLGLGALVFADLVAVLQGLRMLRVLPERVASHFNAAGLANGWMPRETFVYFNLGIVGLMSALFLGLGWAISRLPVSLINLPNKDHWLGPEQRDETLAWLASWGHWMGAQTVFLLVALMAVTVRINLGEPELAGRWFPALLGVFLAAALGQLVRLVLRFRLPD